jgi:glycosyltransferase involved in cell wall biosynthesis
MKGLAFPRDANPYQRLLYEEMRQLGWRWAYAGEITGLRSLNLLLLPLELIWRRLTGWRVLHIHWVFTVVLPWSERMAPLRWGAQAWFAFVLSLARAIGIRVVWTAHNVLPHHRIFYDDVRARRTLVRKADLVIAHSRAGLDALAALDARPRRSVVVPPGPTELGVDHRRLRPPGEGTSTPSALFFGSVAEYKGVEDLLEAVGRMPAAIALDLTIAGGCVDPVLRQRLRGKAEVPGRRITLALERVPGDELARLIEAADLVVLPFRRITTSGSAFLAMAYGRVVVVPDLPAFADLPNDAVVRYDGTVDDLARTLRRLSESPAEALRAIGLAAGRYADEMSWAAAARETDHALRAIGGAA